MTYGSTVVIGVTALFVTPLLLHRLGADGFGVWSLVTTTTAFLTLASLGLETVTTKLVAEEAAHDDAAVVRICCTNFFALCALALVALAVGLAVSFASPYLFRIPHAYGGSAVTAFAIVATEIALSLPTAMFFGVLSGYQRYDLIAWCGAVSTVSVGVSSILVVELGGKLVALAVTTSVVNLVALAMPVSLALRFVPGFTLSRRSVDRRAVRRSASLSAWYMIQSIASVIGEDIDLIVVGAMIGVGGAAVYAVGMKLSRLADKAIGPVQQVFFPHVSAISVEEDSQPRLQATLVDGTRTVMAVAIPIGLILVLLAQPAVRAWVGPGYGVSAHVVMIFGAVACLASLTSASWQLTGGMGKARMTALIGIADALANLGVSISLAKPLGPAGVALGTLISVALVNTPLMVRAATSLVGMPMRTWFRGSVLPHLLPATGCALVLYLLSRVVPASPLPVIGAALCGFVVYEAVYLTVGASKTERDRLLIGLTGAARWLERRRLERRRLEQKRH